MKFFSTTVAMVLASGDDEVASLLQANTWTQHDMDAAISRATLELPKAVKATDAEVDDMVKVLSQDLMQTSTALMQRSVSQQEALLRRASQSVEVSSFIQGYINLPEETKHKVEQSALGSEDLIQMFHTMPEQDRRALLMQLGSTPVDDAVSSKTKTETHRTVDGATGDKKTHTQTVRDGKVVHSHTHVYNRRTGQTETATKSKNHEHAHSHNSKTGKTHTDTLGPNGYQHAHNHQHTYDGDGWTVTHSDSLSKASDKSEARTHSHDHQYHRGFGTDTSSVVTHGDKVHEHHLHGIR